jgi:hypothetical protein
MLLHGNSQRFTKYGIDCLAVGLALILFTFIINPMLANAENVMVSAEIPATGFMSIETDGNNASQTPSNVISFTGVKTSDSSLYERNSSSNVYDLSISIQTNSDDWYLTQSLNSNRLTDNNGNFIDLYWKPNDCESYNKMGSELNPDLLNSENNRGEHEYYLDYALSAPSNTPPGSYTGAIIYTLSYN